MKGKLLVAVVSTAIICSLGGFLVCKGITPKEKCVDAEIKNEDIKEDEPIKKDDNAGKENNNGKNLINHTFTRTYNINHIAYSNDYDYLYITIREFQAEEIETVKVKRSLFEDAQTGDNFEITFKITSNNIEDNLKSIFNNTEITKAVKTDKTGLEQVSDLIE